MQINGQKLKGGEEGRCVACWSRDRGESRGGRQAGGQYLAMWFMTVGERVDDEEKRHGELMRGGEERRVPQQEREGE